MTIHFRKLGQSRVGVLLALALVGCGGGGSGSALPSTTELRASCANLRGKTLEGVTITNTVRIEASSGVNESGLCQVLGTRAPYLDVEVTVPDNWSGRLYQQGGSGFDGRLPSALTSANGTVAAVHTAVTERGAAYAASNGGSRSSNPAQAAPAVWISGAPDSQAAATDYAYRALGTTVAFAKAVTRALYTRNPTYTYFNGCSNGGRNAYIAAERWPAEYSGIVSGCESMDMGGATAGMLATAAKAGTAAEMTPAQYADAYGRAVAACDASDGVVDGYIANPNGCNLAPATLQCGQPGANTNTSLCLTATQVVTLSGLLSDVRLSSGKTIYGKYNWTNFTPPSTIPGVPSQGVASYGGLGGGFALLATNDPRWLGSPPPANTPAPNLATYNLDLAFPLFNEGLLRVGADHDKSAIARYVAGGGKLLSWHDAGDPLISPTDHLRNYNAMTDLVKARGLTDTRANTRMMYVPASTHGAGGNLNEIDWLGAIIDWVENAKAPEQLTYRFTQGAAARTLPVCEAPKYPRYNGAGDVNSAASYTCTQ